MSKETLRFLCVGDIVGKIGRACLENNIKTSVPQFISIGDRVVISTQDGSYLEKAKD